jgi:hypothetical protein
LRRRVAGHAGFQLQLHRLLQELGQRGL